MTTRPHWTHRLGPRLYGDPTTTGRTETASQRRRRRRLEAAHRADPIIGAPELAALLGWHETTVRRYGAVLDGWKDRGQWRFRRNHARWKARQVGGMASTALAALRDADR